MKYFERLGLVREPFSSSPDPGFLFYSRQHITCLQELEIAVRLRRGLNMVIGDIGTGKTTLCRRFVRNLSRNKSISVHLLLDPGFSSARAFLRVLCTQLCGELPDSRLSLWSLKEMIKKALLRMGMREDKTIVLIIDEGQKMSRECLEILRELLNYETNDAKLLQIVIFGQRELEPVVAGMPNFLDRVNFYHKLSPLSFREMRSMIEYRVSKAMGEGSFPPSLFSGPALWTIHRATGGYPRKVVRLCHKSLLQMLIADKSVVTRGSVRRVLREEAQLRRPSRWGWVAAGTAAVVLAGGLTAVRYVPEFRALIPGLDSALASMSDSVDVLVLPENGPQGLRLAPGLRVGDDGAMEPFIPSSEMPEYFGGMHLAKGESLSEAVRLVYGVYDKENLKRVLAANPDLRDPDNVPGATELRFPLVVPRGDALPGGLIWVRLGSSSSLEEAHAKLRQFAFFGLDLRLLPQFSRVGGLRFQIVLEKPETSEQEALARLEKLPLALQKTADAYRPLEGVVLLGQTNAAARKALARAQEAVR
jgi:Type II secretory pathway, component ExeA (predicted ATPase)